MLNGLVRLGRSASYWLALSAFCLAMMGVALYYQYALDHQPCLLCIEVRIIVVATALVAMIALFIRRLRFGAALAHLVVTALGVVFFNRAWKLLGIERGTEMGDCSFNLGLPRWFALDHWFPALFKVQEACGYTPTLWFGITMAQALVVVSAVLCLVSLTLSIAALAACRPAGRGQ